jgi:DNA polymerase III sliding clamp (beta) subunit (PCNA family)
VSNTESNARGKLLAADLARVIDDAAIFALRDTSIPIINAVQLESSPKRLIATATDRFVLGSAVTDYLDETGETWGAALSLAHAQMVSKLAKSTKTSMTDVTIKVEDGKAWFAFTSGETLTVPTVDGTGKFPDWRKIIESRAAEEGSTGTFGVNPQYLAKFGRVTDARRMVIKFSGHNKPGLVNIGTQFVGVIMPFRLDENEAKWEAPEWLERPKPPEPEPDKKAPRARTPRKTAAKKRVAA